MAQNDILAKMAVIISGEFSGFNASLKKSQSQLDGFASNLKRIAGTIGIAFGIREVASFTLEIAKLGGELKGVKAAFDLLPNSAKVLEELKTATGNTVSELELMKRTVQAANFGISLQALPKLLEFATLRAQQTGQSVDYLVDSIVTGIGRKSPLILDNLGISAVALKEKLGNVSTAAASVGQVAEAVGKIAEENLTQMAGFSDNAKTKIEQLSAAWKDFKAQLGTRANEGGIFLVDIPLSILQKFVDVIKEANSDPVMESFNNQTAIAVDNFNKLDKAAQTDAINRLVQDIQKAKKDLQDFNTDVFAGKSGLTPKQYLYELELMQKGIISLQDQYRKFLATYTGTNKETEVSKGLIQDLEDRLKLLNDKKKEAFSVSEVQRFNAEIKRLKDELDLLNVSAPLSRGATSDKPITSSVSNTGSSNIFGVDTSNIDNIVLSLDVLNKKYEESGQSISDWAKAANIAHAAQQEQALQTAQAAVQMGEIIGSAFSEVASGQKTMLNAVIEATGKIIQQFLARAIAGMISSAATSGAPPPVALALAAAGAAAITGLMRKLTGEATGGSGSASVATSNSNSPYYTVQRHGIEVTGRTIIRGQDLVVVYDKAVANNKYSKPGG